MVAAAHPLAVEAGVQMLERGGSAVDAMIATQLVLNAGRAACSRDSAAARSSSTTTRARKRDARHRRRARPRPRAPRPRCSCGADGKPHGLPEARVGGRSVGTPGTPRLLEVAHARYGKLPWKALFEPAIELAEKGFPVSPARAPSCSPSDKGLADEPAARAYFFDADGKPSAAGTLLRNPELRPRRCASSPRKGADAFYTGEIARDIVAAVRGPSANPGTLSVEDLAGYRVRDVEPLCGAVPRAGASAACRPRRRAAIAVLQMLGVLERTTWRRCGRVPPQAVHLFSEAERLAFADRNRYVADDRFVDVPVQGLRRSAATSPRARSASRREKSMGRAERGHAAGREGRAWPTTRVDEVGGHQPHRDRRSPRATPCR